jgi:glycerate 2-kinase
VDIAKSCGPDDLLIVLITGGGSALFPYPKPPLTLQEKSALIKELSRQGASIQELNAVRKRLSLVKGGGLITLSPCKTILSLILSDVLGDPLDVIASGPTVPSPDLDELAGQIVEKYLAPSSVPKNVQTVLSKSSTEVSTANRTVINSIIGNNSIALEAASEKARELGLLPVIVTNELSGEASKVGLEMATLACCISHKISQVTNERDSTIRKAASNMNLPKERTDSLIESLNDPKVRTDFDGICLLFGGETTVTVKGNGVGGRNQELALKAAAQIDTSANNEYVKGKVAVLSGGTDGFDGPCDAAGAVVNSDTVRSGNLKKLSPYQFLTANDSYNYFKENSDGAFHIKTGHTETNVMDLVVIVVVK